MSLPNSSPARHTPFRLAYPKGFMRLFYRLPILVYRLGLGWIFGQRFLLLEHLGRRSGVMKQAVIEVIDRNHSDGSYVVAAAWGAQSDWFRNILKTPRVHVTVSTHKFPATAGPIPSTEAEHSLRIYSLRHPIAFKQIGALLIDQEARGKDEIVQAFAASIPFVRFTPIREDDQDDLIKAV